MHKDAFILSFSFFHTQQSYNDDDNDDDDDDDGL